MNVIRGVSRPRRVWHATLPRRRAGSVGRVFPVDGNGRIRDFASDAEARRACDAVLVGEELMASAIFRRYVSDPFGEGAYIIQTVGKMYAQA